MPPDPLRQGRNEVCGIRDQRGEIGDQKEGDLGPQPWDQESQTMGSGSAVSYRDQGSGCTTFVGSGTKSGHAFGIKEQKFAYKNGISDEKTYLVTTLS